MKHVDIFPLITLNKDRETQNLSGGTGGLELRLTL